MVDAIQMLLNLEHVLDQLVVMTIPKGQALKNSEDGKDIKLCFDFITSDILYPTRILCK